MVLSGQTKENNNYGCSSASSKGGIPILGTPKQEQSLTGVSAISAVPVS